VAAMGVESTPTLPAEAGARTNLSRQPIMPIRIYRLTSISMVTAVGQASTVVVNKGRIKQVVMTGAYIVGAAAGRIAFETSLNNTANGNAETATGAPSENLIARMSTCVGLGSAVSNQSMVVPCDIPVTPGNNLCINVLQSSGTAPSSGVHAVDLHVQE